MIKLSGSINKISTKVLVSSDLSAQVVLDIPLSLDGSLESLKSLHDLHKKSLIITIEEER